jgi:hypothetical protein
MRNTSLYEIGSQPSIRDVTLLDIIKGHHVRTKSLDQCITHHLPISISDKVQLGIHDKNLIMKPSDFPLNPSLGQVVNINGKLYKFIGIEIV